MSANNIILCLVYLFEVYFLLGFLFAIPFLLRGVQKLDENAIGSSIWLKLLWLPGVCALWPLLLSKWIRLSKIQP